MSDTQFLAIWLQLFAIWVTLFAIMYTVIRKGRR